MMVRRCLTGLFLLFLIGVSTGCDRVSQKEAVFRIVTDQLGRKVAVPEKLTRIAALRHFGGKIVYALGKQNLLVEQGIYGKEAQALARIDPQFAALPSMVQGHAYNVEGIVALNPQLVFVYASMDLTQIDQFEQAGVKTFAVKGETIEESFEAVRLMADVLGCKKRGDAYIEKCQTLLEMVQKRLEGHVTAPVKVLFAGPKSIYSAATGNMLQNRILELSGAKNVAESLTGFWVDVSPEQIAQWNPDVIFLGSYLDVYGKEKIMTNPHFATVSAVKSGRIFSFPSNIGWWDYPAPHCVLGVVWSAKTLYPDLFKDINMTRLADEIYQMQVGHTFQEMGGVLRQ